VWCMRGGGGKRQSGNKATKWTRQKEKRAQCGVRRVKKRDANDKKEKMGRGHQGKSNQVVVKGRKMREKHAEKS